jgi:hypothetical protein
MLAILPVLHVGALPRSLLTNGGVRPGSVVKLRSGFVMPLKRVLGKVNRLKSGDAGSKMLVVNNNGV